MLVCLVDDVFHHTGVVGGDEVAMDAELSADLIEDERKVLSVSGQLAWNAMGGEPVYQLLCRGQSRVLVHGREAREA